ncbi:hypothetical protein JH299_00665 [Xanthomonas campestris pv. incanae]|uniref:hypothetical protein n=1 Tax=Xanthomonas campestris TaxID=339 RepID=UPI002367A251|nr:hypothetical protein [Xanthomonas campestris]WDJ10148.1 hypothetical protein JH299_00665 [Xanthomonas campestris pv. incanae]
MGKRYQVPEGLYINVSFPTRFAKALKNSAKKAVTLRGDACAMCLACPGLVVVLPCCLVASVLTLRTEDTFLAVAVAVPAAPLGQPIGVELLWNAARCRRSPLWRCVTPHLHTV